MATQHRRYEPVTPSSQFDADGFQQALARWNRSRLSPSFPGDVTSDTLAADQAMTRLERGFLEALRSQVRVRAAAAPVEAHGFIAWFEELKQVGPGQGDPLFPWLAEEASRDDIRWFLTQEAAGEAGFDDLVAATQVKMPVRPKLELANNYWDEMGHGNERGMHGPMLAGLVDTLALEPSIENTVWQSLALANAMTGMAFSRAYAWHSVGALGVIELTAPGRSAYTAQALRRIGLSDRERRYFSLHAVLDVKHSADWNREVIAPLVSEDPRRAHAIAEGALMRLECGRACFDAYRAHLWGPQAAA